MIKIYHNTKNVTRILSDKQETIGFETKKSIATVLMQMATQFPDEIIGWCHQDMAESVDWEVFPEVLPHHKIMVSYAPASTFYLGREIGYVEESPFIKVNKKVRYPTWQMSSEVGAVHAGVLLQFKDKIKEDRDFDYFLHSIAKVGMPFGLFCYSEPRLLNTNSVLNHPKASLNTKFRFVKQHYKTRWLFLFFLDLMLYEKRFPILALLNALFYKNRNISGVDLKAIVVQSSNIVVKEGTIDVIIPTIGRKKYLYDVLRDLAQQTHLPKNVIIVEQNPQPDSVSELDYITTESWPFVIKHTFTHQAGACNARNVALEQVESEWVFLNDDDNRFAHDLIAKIFENIKKYGEKCVTNSYLQPHEKLVYIHIKQSGIFGSGNSFVHSDLLHQVSFDPALEFGYGEDTDFGLQLRNIGADIVYFPEPEITHLKAPMGGFRTKPNLQWKDEPIPPKPSPTIMYLKQKYDNREQILGYKTILFIKYYRMQSTKNPFRYFVTFQQQWKVSNFWANLLKEQHEI